MSSFRVRPTYHARGNIPNATTHNTKKEEKDKNTEEKKEDNIDQKYEQNSELSNAAAQMRGLTPGEIMNPFFNSNQSPVGFSHNTMARRQPSQNNVNNSSNSSNSSNKNNSSNNNLLPKQSSGIPAINAIARQAPVRTTSINGNAVRRTASGIADYL